MVVNYAILSKILKRSIYNAELSKYNVSIRTHMHVSQGICIPLEMKHDLARKVTTRKIH